MNLITKYKNILTILVVVIAAFIAYSFFFGGAPEAVLSSDVPSEQVAVDHELIALLLELKGIRLDDSIFADPVFMSLQDFSQELVPEPVGRDNPFAPLNSR